MKHIVISFLLLFSLSAFSQTNPNIIKYNDGHQKGYHIIIDGEYKPHGLWKHSYGKARYDKGELIWLKLKNGKKWSGEEIKIAKLERKIKRLETHLASN